MGITAQCSSTKHLHIPLSTRKVLRSESISICHFSILKTDLEMADGFLFPRRPIVVSSSNPEAQYNMRAPINTDCRLGSAVSTNVLIQIISANTSCVGLQPLVMTHILGIARWVRWEQLKRQRVKFPQKLRNYQHKLHSNLECSLCWYLSSIATLWLYIIIRGQLGLWSRLMIIQLPLLFLLNVNKSSKTKMLLSNCRQ